MSALPAGVVVRVLVIDDNAAIQQDFRKIFDADRGRARPSAAEVALFGESAEGDPGTDFEIESAFQGEEGLGRVRQALDEGAPYAVAFIDMRMPPGWDGIETARQIWIADPDIQTVICTAYSDYSWSEMIARLGRSDRLVILKKPFDTIEVMQLATALAEKWRLARQSRNILQELERRVGERTRELARTVEKSSQSEAQYRMLFAGNPSPMWVYDTHTLRILLVNAAAVSAYGFSEDEFLAMTIPQLRPAADVPAEGAPDPMSEQGWASGEWRHQTRDGRVIEVAVTSDLVEFEGWPARLVMANDVTERRQAEDRIRRLNRVYAVLSGINTLIVRVRNRDELFREACRIASQDGGFRMAMIALTGPGEGTAVVHAFEGVGEALLGLISRVLASAETASATMVGRAIRERRSVLSNDSLADPQVVFGQRYAEAGVRSIVVLPLLVGDVARGTLMLYSEEPGFFDAEELKLLEELAGDIAFAIDYIEKQELLDYLAYYDVLTGLANRTLFLERLTQSMRGAASNGHKLALYVLDVERFKNLNDTLGQAAGDELLRQIAAWLLGATGDASRVARVGADQFCVVITEVRHLEDVARDLESALKAFVDHSFVAGGDALRIAAKAGVAIFPDDGAEAGTLFQNAEAALKKAKAKGDRYLFYAEKMTDMVAGRLTLESRMRQALELGEFVLHYQPKVSLATGALTGAEALIRWNDPRTGLVPPMHFIPLLEETGLIREVGRWALRQALEDFLRWRGEGRAPARIAVNVSPLQLRAPSFLDEIRQALEIGAGAAAGLELEITESVIMEDAAHSIEVLRAVRLMGVTVAIDDFGTGYSSLSHLARLPVDTLKIDRSFVSDMDSSEGLALVTTIIRMAQSMKLKVVAEGVETQAQADLLRSLGCDEMQGYLFSRPVPGALFAERFLLGAPAVAA